MVEEQSGLFGVGQALQINGLKLPYRQRPRGILGKRQVYLGNNNVSGSGVTPRLLAQDFLS